MKKGKKSACGHSVMLDELAGAEHGQRYGFAHTYAEMISQILVAYLAVMLVKAFLMCMYDSV